MYRATPYLIISISLCLSALCFLLQHELFTVFIYSPLLLALQIHRQIVRIVTFHCEILEYDGEMNVKIRNTKFSYIARVYERSYSVFIIEFLRIRIKSCNSNRFLLSIDIGWLWASFYLFSSYHTLYFVYFVSCFLFHSVFAHGLFVRLFYCRNTFLVNWSAAIHFSFVLCALNNTVNTKNNIF